VANISQSLDQLMIGKFIIEPKFVAYYNVASRINLLVDIPSYAAAEVLFPKASRASAEGDQARVKFFYERMVAILLSFTIPLALVIISFPTLFTYIVGGPAYALAAPILQIYMITGIFRPAQNQAANLLNSMGKSKITFWANTGTLTIALVSNYICLRVFGFYGAAIGTVIATLLGFIAWYFIMRRQIGLELHSVWNHSIATYRTLFRRIRGFVSRSPTS